MSTELERRWIHLANLLGAYFHQDFDAEYDSPEAVLDGFAAEEDAEFVRAAASEARSFAASGPDDELLAEMRRAGIGYAFWAEGWTSKAWLEFVADRLDAAVETKGAE